jgi:CRP-like cAMP-binding protein/small-conductance mechanosensitive channel
MKKRKSFYIVINIVVFVLCGLVLLSGIFDQSQSVFDKNPLDHFYLMAVNFLFWIPGAYLINSIVEIVLWKKIIILPVGNKSFRLLQDFINSLIYISALAAFLCAAFFIELSFLNILLFLLLLLFMVLLKPKLASLLNIELINRNRPFNKDDRIIIKDLSGQPIAEGEVYSFNRESVSIKNGNNNLVFISNKVLADSIIENYDSFKGESRYGFEISLDGSIPIERAKRILFATVLDSLDNANLLKKRFPEILVGEIGIQFIKYEVYYWMETGNDILSSQIKDAVLSKIYFHMEKAGLLIDSREIEKNSNVIPIFQNSELNSVKNKTGLLKKINFFNVLNDEELEQIASGLSIQFVKKGNKIIVQGEKDNSMYILAEGLMIISISKNNEEKIRVGKIVPGDFLGEMSLFTGEPRAADVEAFSDCCVFKMTKELLNPVLQNRQNLVEEFGKLIVERQSFNAEILAQSGVKESSILNAVVQKIKSFFHIN